MRIATASPLHTPQIRTIWKECFGDTDAYIHAFFSHVYKPENTLVACDGEAVVGALQIFPKTAYANGIPHSAVYIGGVSVLPAYRCRGIATAMIRKALETAADIAFLVPVRVAFYEKMGFRCVSYLSDYTGERALLLPHVSHGGVTVCKTITPDLYARCMQGRQFYLGREDFAEASYLCDGLQFACTDGGYMLYTMENGVFFALELMFTTEHALAHLLGFIYEHSETAFRIRTAADGTLRRILCEIGIREERFPHAMVYNPPPDIGDGICTNNYINMLGWF